ncbi:MAG: efflux RND transporter permease subunit [Candidatus Latescibacteria bacterium]|nr:efflux RND transporter permease subunit [Candidatus Latescibacterota bacterium]
MINQIIDWCARNKFLVLLATAFLVAWGVWAMFNVPLDAIPDLSDVQVIVFTEWPGRSPDLVEDQITYPIVTKLLAAPNVQRVQAISDFGVSYVYVIFEDGTDLYWARSRVSEYMQGVAGRLPEGVTPVLGPDATGVGWVFEYALVDETGRHNLQELRSFQDWSLRYWLQAVPGVAEVASVGGYVKSYQVNLDPNKLFAYRIPLSRVVDAIRRSNNDVGGRSIEVATAEFMVRGRGYVKSVADLERVPVGTDERGTPIYLRDLGEVQLGPDMRRGLAELNGRGETVGGIVVMRYGENALDVINRVKQRLAEVKDSFPPGVKLVITYDRAELIERAIETLKGTLTEELLIVSLVILLFLLHIPSAIIPILTIPIAVVIAFIPMSYMGLTANIMSLGGIAIAIGALVDAAIVVVEQTHKKLEHWDAEGRPGDYQDVVIRAVKEVGGPSFFSLLVIAVSFMPIFTLVAQEGRLFKPLAFTKNFSMAIAAVLAITLDPAIRLLFTHAKAFNFSPRWLCRMANAVLVGTIHSEERHPISRPLMRLYQPVVEFVLRHRWAVVVTAGLLVALTVPVYFQLGSEFMPPLNEGSILFMPTAVPGMSITEGAKVLQLQDRVLAQFPEVKSVFGKIGRSTSPTDPAPLSMVETTIILKPQNEWRTVHEDRWYSGWAVWPLNTLFGLVWPEERPMTWDELVSEIDPKVKVPGMANIWWMPVQTRTEMLSTGIRSNLGIKVFGPDLTMIDTVAVRVERVLKDLPGTRSVFAERTTGGYYLDFNINREAAARYGLTVGDVEDIIETAIGGMDVSRTVEGRERYPITVRYLRELRDDPDMLRRVLVPTPAGAQVPLSLLADIQPTTGAPMIRDENGQLQGFVFVDVTEKDYEGYIERAQQVVQEKVSLPPGYRIEWAGQYKYLLRTRERLKYILPLTLFIVFVLLYLNTKSVVKTWIVLLAVPFSAVGAIWLLALLDYNMSIGVWVGLIALMGVDAETGVFMLLYLDLAYEERRAKGRMNTLEDLKEAIIYGAVKRVRPKVMTVGVMFMGLLPIMWSAGTGADLMKRIAAPMIGGIFTSFIMELMVYPVIYEIWRGRGMHKAADREGI